MPANEIHVPYGHGHIAVRDHQGSGRDVVLVHSPGMCALNWEATAQELAGRCRAYALDLPGHAHSTAEMNSFDDSWRCIAAVVRELGLDRPLLVGHDNAAFMCLVAAASEPELYCGVVTVGGSNVRTPQEAQEFLDFMRSPEFRELLHDRFTFGETTTAQEGPQVLIDRIVESVKDDWVLEGIEERIREEAAYSIRPLPDGGYINTPTVETIDEVLTLSADPTYRIDSSIYSHVTLPTWLLQLSDGFDARASQAERELAAELPQLRRGVLTSGQWPQYTAPKELADLLVHIAQDPSRPGVDFDS